MTEPWDKWVTIRSKMEQSVLDQTIVIDPQDFPAFMATGRNTVSSRTATKNALDQQAELYRMMMSTPSSNTSKQYQPGWETTRYTAFFKGKWAGDGACVRSKLDASLNEYRNGTLFSVEQGMSTDWFIRTNGMVWPIHPDRVPKHVQAMALIF